MNVVMAAILLVVTGNISAQAKPDFSGAWIEDESMRQTTNKAEAAQKAMALPSRPVTVRQSADAIHIEHAPPFPDFPSLRYAFNLAGRESVNHNGANTLTTRSRWEGNRLVTEGTSFSETSQGEFTWKFRETRWLDTKGRMVVETRTTDEAAKTHVVTQTYDRK